MPEAAFAGLWMKSSHKLWVKRLRRTSSLAELLQVCCIPFFRLDDIMLEPFCSVLSYSVFSVFLSLCCLSFRFLLILWGQWMRIGCTKVHHL
jgi:hypothetical protein